MASLSPLGRKRAAAGATIAALSVAVIIYAVRVNRFQNFFFIADRLPLILGSVMLGLYALMLPISLSGADVFLGRAPFVLALEVVLSILWIAGNTFSTSRWRNIPFHCSAIPTSFPDERTWCQNVQTLQSLVWTLLALQILTILYAFFALFRLRAAGAHYLTSSPLSCARAPATRNFDVVEAPYAFTSPTASYGAPKLEKLAPVSALAAPMATRHNSALSASSDPFARGPAELPAHLAARVPAAVVPPSRALPPSVMRRPSSPSAAVRYAAGYSDYSASTEMRGGGARERSVAGGLVELRPPAIVVRPASGNEVNSVDSSSMYSTDVRDAPAEWSGFVRM